MSHQTLRIGSIKLAVLQAVDIQGVEVDHLILCLARGAPKKAHFFSTAVRRGRTFQILRKRHRQKSDPRFRHLGVFRHRASKQAWILWCTHGHYSAKTQYAKHTQTLFKEQWYDNQIMPLIPGLELQYGSHWWSGITRVKARFAHSLSINTERPLSHSFSLKRQFRFSTSSI